MARDITLALLILSFLIVLRQIIKEAVKLLILKKSDELISEGNAILALQERSDFNLNSKILVRGKWAVCEFYNYLSAIRYLINASEILLEPMSTKLIANDCRFVEVKEKLNQIKREAAYILENYSKEERNTS